MIDTLSAGQVGLSLLAGSLTTLSPCVFPMLPLVVGGALQSNRLAPVVMGGGMAVSFALIGLLLGALGPALGVDSESIRHVGAWLLIAFAVVMLVPAFNARFTGWMTPIAASANNASGHFQSGSLSGAFILGGLLGLVWSPCSGPLLGSALSLVASEDGGALRGGAILGLFGVGAAMPLVAAAYASRSGFSRVRGWVMRHSETVRLSFAVLIGATGIAILSGGDRWLEAQVLDRLPDSWIFLTTRY